MSPRTSTSTRAATPPASAVKIRPSCSASGRPGRISSSTAPPCTLTASGTNSPARASRTDRATSVPAFSCASAVLAPRCGVTTTLSKREQRAVGARLAGVDVQRGPGHPAVGERAGQRGLVHDPAARRVDDPHLGLDQVQLAVAEQADGLGGARQVDADEVGLGQQLVQAGQADAQLRRPGPPPRTGRRRPRSCRTRPAARRPARRSCPGRGCRPPCPAARRR